jgi:hypothetical protein
MQAESGKLVYYIRRYQRSTKRRWRQALKVSILHMDQLVLT